MLKFAKYHGLGNDFIIMDLRNTDWLPNIDWLLKFGNRNLGIGFDQALFITKASIDVKDSVPVFGFKIANSDGSWASQCGNGARCVADFLQRKQLFVNSCYLELADRLMLVESAVNGDFIVDMGPAIIDTGVRSIDTPWGIFAASLVTIGNKHLVVDLTEQESLFMKLGAWCQTRFDGGINFNAITAIQDDYVKLRVYERGAQETLACASGACSTAVAINNLGYQFNPINIKFKYGILKISLGETIKQSGSTSFCFTGTI